MVWNVHSMSTCGRRYDYGEYEMLFTSTGLGFESRRQLPGICGYELGTCRCTGGTLW